MTVTLTASDESGIDYTKYRIDGSSWITYTAPFTISGDGSHIIEFYSVDKVGNKEPYRSCSFRIDQTKLSSYVKQLSETQTSNSFTVSWVGSDAISGVKCYDIQYKKDNGLWTDWLTCTTLTSATPVTSQPTPSHPPTPTISPPPEITPTPIPKPSPTPTATPIPTPTTTPIPSPTLQPIPTPSPTPKSTPISTATPTPIFKHYYNREVAIKYAKKFAKTPSSIYPYFTGRDCTNFVSQCLLHGGWSMKEPPLWYHFPVLGWIFKQFYNRDDGLWFFYSNEKEEMYSHTWTVADDFRKFVKKSKRGKIIELGSLKDVEENLKRSIIENRLRLGDIIQIDLEGNGDTEHSMIIVNVSYIYVNGKPVEVEDIDFAFHSWGTPSNDTRSYKEILKETSEKYSSATFCGLHLFDHFDE